MGKFLLTKKALEDLKEIWNYTFDTWSEQQADKYYEELLHECQTLAEDPTKGKNYGELIKGLKAAKINKHLVFYRQIQEDLIEVERILHERMDLRTKLDE